MHPFPNPMLGGGARASFIGKVDGPSSGGPATLHANAQAGDLGVIITNAPASPSGWAVESLGNCYVFSKVLASGDLSGVTLGGSVGSWGTLVYRGATSLVRRSSISVPGSPPMTIPGFTKAGARGLLTATVTSANMSATTPTGFSARQSFVGDGGFRLLHSADLLPAGGYTNGADIVWTGSGTSGGSAIAFEIT